MTHLATVIGTKVRAHRNAKGLSQTKLAALADTTPHAVTSIEGFHRVPTIAVLIRLAAALDVTVDELVYADGTPNTAN